MKELSWVGLDGSSTAELKRDLMDFGRDRWTSVGCGCTQQSFVVPGGSQWNSAELSGIGKAKDGMAMCHILMPSR